MADRRFRGGVLAQEAVRTVAGHSALSALAVSTALLAGLLVPALTGAEVGAVETEAAERVLAGSTVLTISAKDRVPLPAARCDALRSVAGVAGAGGVTESATVPAADGSSVTLVTATPGYAEVVWPGAALRRDESRSAVAGSLLGSRAGLSGSGTLAGVVVDGESRALRIDQVAAASPRIPFLDRAVVVAEPATGTVVECFVEADDEALAGVEAIALSWFPAEYESTIAPFDPALGPGDALDSRLAGRLSAAGPPLGAALGALGIGATWLARRRDLALYRSLGMSSPRLLLALTVETALQTGVGLLIGVGAAAVLLPWSPLALRLAASDVGALLALTALIPLAGLALSPRGRGLEALRGR
ncbi:hypothetical protein GRS96_15400 [Rathayibacter sp. VKM Ac-2803]|uniref:hypothetical protein n=1 Tax=unclassified Rathayibacter TaxID=2609250 RepID=UPI00135A147C|nr:MULTISPECIES: hypothetical protein [unclassified Rathayibacter]MWV50659.1 hypothetical protein [Rathayibacter sp. VKM Ac-2803]MWV59659.1 hypothetical protein [Rathayibacter sp. VKM Ac-2754]